MQACVENRDGLAELSMERIRDEIFKILLTPNVVKTLQIMIDNNIMDYIMPAPHHMDKLAFLSNLVEEENIPHRALRRLFIIYQPDVALAENLALRLRLSKKEKQLFVDLTTHDICLDNFTDDKSLARLVYQRGKEFCKEKFLLLLSEKQSKIPEFSRIMNKIETFDFAEFPVKGRDIMEQGIDDPRNISSILKELEAAWIESNFTLTKEQLLALRHDFNKAACE